MSRPYDPEHDIFVHDMWPGGIGRRQGDEEHAPDAPLWMVIPPSLDALCAWLVINRRPPPFPDHTRQHVVEYTQGLEAPQTQFTFKVQGVLQQCHIGALGSWNFREFSASKATRSITLCSGGCDAPFAIQRGFLQHLKEFIIRTLDPSTVDIPVDTRETLYFRENVFARARPGVTGIPLNSMDDPHGHAARVASRWVVTRKVAMHSAVPSGNLTRASVLQFRLGDFVEVEAYPDIVTTFNGHKLKVEVFFAPLSIVRLCSAADAASRGKVRFQVAPTPSTSTSGSAPAVPSPVDLPSSSDAECTREWRAALQASFFPRPQ